MNRKLLILVGMLLVIPMCMFAQKNTQHSQSQQIDTINKTNPSDEKIKKIKNALRVKGNPNDEQFQSLQPSFNPRINQPLLSREGIQRARSGQNSWISDDPYYMSKAMGSDFGKSKYDQSVTYGDIMAGRSLSEIRAERRNEEIKTILINVGIGIVVVFFIFQLIRTANKGNNSKTIEE